MSGTRTADMFLSQKATDGREGEAGEGLAVSWQRRELSDKRPEIFITQNYGSRFLQKSDDRYASYSGRYSLSGLS